ncbi:hypothetical protein SAMN05192575_1153 [Nocardioides alpinus]|uniref:Uncharacterized protein n=1 Tax=Nocardioides alpinus TaxID=748909 RepID=A0A1I1B8C0_9ACTN|nr:hypothetical protein SAMN05192575_1153 [Nocardioides alpinus]
MLQGLLIVVCVLTGIYGLLFAMAALEPSKDPSHPARREP